MNNERATLECQWVEREVCAGVVEPFGGLDLDPTSTPMRVAFARRGQFVFPIESRNPSLRTSSTRLLQSSLVKMEKIFKESGIVQVATMCHIEFEEEDSL